MVPAAANAAPLSSRASRPDLLALGARACARLCRREVGAFLSCFTLVFALLGCINRMRFSSDANVQKTMGMFTDLWGAVSLLYTLFNFSR
jgi:hypothetical protein